MGLVDKNNYYLELFAGLENILKLFRVDVVNAFQPGFTGTSPTVAMRC